jgi:hypothetical protein
MRISMSFHIYKSTFFYCRYCSGEEIFSLSSIDPFKLSINVVCFLWSRMSTHFSSAFVQASFESVLKTGFCFVRLQ